MFPTDSRLWSRVAEAKVLADFSKAEPSTALLTGRREKGKWKLLPFATADLQGTAISTFRDTEATPLQLPLNTTGWHAVYVGICTTSGGLDKAVDNAIRVKLSGEPVHRRMANGLPILKPRRDQIQEVFLTAADVTGQSIDVAPVPHKPATICYVKLVPLTEAETAAWKKYQPDPATRTSIVTFDGHSWIWPYRPRTAEHLRETFRGLERTDINKWWFQVTGADLVCYPSKVGNIPGDGTVDFSRWEYQDYTKSLRALFAAGINPLQVAREEAARQGAEFHVMIRPAGWVGSLPWEEDFNSKFYAAHPEWRCVDRDGTPAMFMSYAVPQVRRRVLDVLRETLELKPEGVGFLFHRGMPMMLWEDAFCEAFRKQHNVDAKQVPEDDPRILATRAELMTTFLREVRTLLDETAKQQQRATPYKISLATFSREADNAKFGIDLPRWIREGLVDELSPAYFAHHTSFSPPDMAYYKRLTSGSKVGLYPMVIAWHSGTPQQLCAKVTSFYQGGANGIAIWDLTSEAGYRDGSPGQVYDIASRLGHRELIAAWSKPGATPQPHSIPLTRLGDNHYSRWFPNTGF